MNKISFYIGVVAAIGVLVSSCNSSQVTEKSDQAPQKYQEVRARDSFYPKSELTDEALMGQWRTACVLDLDKTDMYRLDQLTIDGLILELSTTYYQDSQCTIGYYEQAFVGVGSIEDSTLTIQLAMMDVKPLASIMSAIFQMGNYCGVKEWGVGTLRSFDDVSSCGASSEAKYNIELYGEKELYLNDVKYMKHP